LVKESQTVSLEKDLVLLRINNGHVSVNGSLDSYLLEVVFGGVSADRTEYHGYRVLALISTDNKESGGLDNFSKEGLKLASSQEFQENLRNSDRGFQQGRSVRVSEEDVLFLGLLRGKSGLFETLNHVFEESLEML